MPTSSEALYYFKVWGTCRDYNHLPKRETQVGKPYGKGIVQTTNNISW